MTSEPCLVCGDKVEVINSVNINQRDIFCQIHKVEGQMMKELDQLNEKLNTFIDEFKSFKERARERICKYELQQNLSLLRLSKP